MLTSNISKNEGGDDLDTFKSTSNHVSNLLTKFGIDKKVNAIQDLPKELLAYIYEFTGKTASQTFVLGNVCKEFQHVFNNDDIWKPILDELCSKSKQYVQKNYRFVYLQVSHLFRREEVLSKKRVESQLKVVMLGAFGVGKSSLMIRFIQGIFVEEYDPTIEDPYRKMYQMGQDVYQFDILDTAAPEENSALRDIYHRMGEGFLMCFSMTDRSSFDKLGDIIDDVSRVKDIDHRNIPMVLVGCKSDLVNEYAVTEDEIKSFSIKSGHPYILTSSLDNVNIDQCFELVIGEWLCKISEPQWVDMMDGKIVFPPIAKSKNKCLVM